MATTYPITLDSYVNKIDGVDDVLAVHPNDLQDAVSALQLKLGIDASVDITSVDWILKNALSLDPGHQHSGASIASLEFSKLVFSGLTARHALIANGPTSAIFQSILESDIVDGAILARLAAAESVAGFWEFLAGAKFDTGVTLRNGINEVRHAAGPTAGSQVFTWGPDGSPGFVVTSDGAGNLTLQPPGGASPGNNITTTEMLVTIDADPKTIAGLIPAGVTLFGVAVYVESTLALAGTIDIGFGGANPVLDAWGTGISPTAGSTNNGTMNKVGSFPTASALDIVITSIGSIFDQSGQVNLKVFYLETDAVAS